MATTVNKIIELAQSWVGKNEKDGSFKDIIDIYNNHKPLARGYKVKYTDSWCATFVSALAIKCGATDIIPTECSCQKMIDLFKALDVWVENENRTPKPGDIIFYDWDDNGKGDNKGWSDHVGIVEKVSGSTITVIEGNYSNSVKRRTVKTNEKCIRGYAVPKYAADAVYYAKYTGKSIFLDTILKAVGVPAQYRGSWRKRVPIAEINGITGYKGTSAQNSKIKSLAKQGKLRKTK